MVARRHFVYIFAVLQLCGWDDSDSPAGPELLPPAIALPLGHGIVVACERPKGGVGARKARCRRLLAPREGVALICDWFRWIYATGLDTGANCSKMCFGGFQKAIVRFVGLVWEAFVMQN